MSLAVLALPVLLAVALLDLPGATSQNWPLPLKRPEITGRVLKGKEVESGAASFQALIRLRGGFLCGGSLITSQYVLTAASCLPGDLKPWGRNGLTVSLGAVKVSDSEGVLTYRIEEEDVTRHPSYAVNWPTTKHDLALIRLPRIATDDGNVSSVRLATPDMYHQLHPQSALVYGWGISTSNIREKEGSKTLKVGSIGVMSHAECDDEFLERYSKSFTPFKLCTMDPGSGVCLGDNGGPLIVDQQTTAAPGTSTWPYNTTESSDKPCESFIQIGIITDTRHPCTPGRLTTYTYVAPYVDWIYSTIKIQDHLETLD